jgi:phosphoglycolate phosphatase-like HAD superfamily hydrolase
VRTDTTLVLWDIDHTLISVKGLSGEIYAAVFHEVTGRRMERLADMAGRTDLAITAETLRMHGMTPTTEVLDAFGVSLAAGFSAREGDISARGRVLAGARSVLAELSARADVVQSVLTGNMAEIAVSKLSAFGLDGYVDFEVGAFGFDDAHRPRLVEMARDRAERKYGRLFGPEDTVLIGDTPLDVDAGHRGDGHHSCTATGSSDEETLREAGAESVLADLSDTCEVIRAVLGPNRS